MDLFVRDILILMIFKKVKKNILPNKQQHLVGQGLLIHEVT
jgi:hypothetical protein